MKAAVHELGHVVAFEAAGVTVRKVVVTGHGPAAEGQTFPGRYQITSTEQGFGLLVAALAGRAAEVRWCARNNMPVFDHTCADDMAAYRDLHRHRLLRHVRDREVIAAAEQLVARHWSRITSDAKRLARTGRL
jgi:hypothetical protein